MSIDVVAGRLCDTLASKYVASGDLLRRHRARSTPLGRAAAQDPTGPAGQDRRTAPERRH